MCCWEITNPSMKHSFPETRCEADRVMASVSITLIWKAHEDMAYMYLYTELCGAGCCRGTGGCSAYGGVQKRGDRRSQSASGNWNKDRQELMGFQLRRKDNGVIGCGHIGTRFAMIMKYGFQNRILAYDPYADKEKVYGRGIQLCDLDTLLEESDFITLHANLNENSRHLINAQTLAKMKDRAILINTGRGPLVDEAAA